MRPMGSAAASAADLSSPPNRARMRNVLLAARLEIHTPRLYSSDYCAPAPQGERVHPECQRGAKWGVFASLAARGGVACALAKPGEIVAQRFQAAGSAPSEIPDIISRRRTRAALRAPALLGLWWGLGPGLGGPVLELIWGVGLGGWS